MLCYASGRSDIAVLRNFTACSGALKQISPTAPGLLPSHAGAKYLWSLGVNFYYDNPAVSFSLAGKETMEINLRGLKIAILAADGFEQVGDQAQRGT
jgi:hypothetical protein